MSLSDKQQEELVQYWNTCLTSGKEYKKKFAKPETWKKYKEYYRGDWSSDILPTNKVFSHGKTLVPKVYFRDPAVTITATRPELEWHARVVEQVDNYLIRELDLKTQIKRASLDAYLCGIGILKTGYDSEFGYIPELTAGEDGETVTQVEKKDPEINIEYRENVKPAMPWTLRVDPNDIITPWGYTHPESLPWIAHRIIRPLEDVQADPKYSNTKDLKGGIVDLKEKRGITPLADAKEEIYCELWEIRDLKHKKFIILCEETILLSVDDELIIEGLPFDFIIFNEDPDSFWPISEVKILEPQQKELNEIRTQASKHRKLALLKVLYLQGSIKTEELEKFKNGEIMPFIEVSGETLAGAVLPMQASHVPPELWRESQEVNNDIRETLGESRNQAGEFVAPQGTPRTATEVMKVNEASNMRADEKRDMVADVLVKIIRKWNQIIFKFWTGKRVTQIAGPDGLQKWISYTGTQLKGEYFLRIDPDSGLPVTKGLRYSQAKELYAAFNGDPMVDQLQLRKLLLRQSEWIDPAWTLIIPHTSQTLPMEVLAFLKQSGIKTMGENTMPQMANQMPMNAGPKPISAGGQEVTDLSKMPVNRNAPLPL